MLTITAMGMISAVGRDAATSCAAMRAGISRARGIHTFTVLDLDEHEQVPLIACPIHGFTEGFLGLAAWIRLGAAALRDLLRSARLPTVSDRVFWQETAFLVVTPVLDEQRFDGTDWSPASVLRDYALTVAQNCGLPLRSELSEIIPEGHAGGAVAVQRAAELLGQGLPRVLVLAADSFLDPNTLSWLDDEGRLKTPDNPAGLIPGEAAACLLLEPGSPAQRPNGRVLATVQQSASEFEQDNYRSGKRSQGRALASAVESVLQPSARAVFDGDLVADLNGEEWRAYELGCVRVRLRSCLDDTMRISYPAISFGETGAVAGIAGLCVGARSIERGYAQGGTVLITSSSDHGRVGALFLTC